MGTALWAVQNGETPESAKPLKGIGKGVFEIICDFDTDTYRSVYAVQFQSAVYVLDSFQKKSTHGIKTPKHIVDRIKDRYAAAAEIEESIKKGK